MDPQILVNKLPVEIWLHIINFIGESQFDFYFTSKNFFRLAKYFRDPINSKKSKNLIKEAIIRRLPCIVNYILKIIKNNKPEFNNKLFDNLGKNEYFRQCVKHNIHNVVDYFVSKNIDINAVNEFGKTPLITAIKSGNCIMVKKLIDYGADLLKSDTYGNKMYKLAFDHRHNDIFIFLIDKNIESDKTYNKIKNEFGSIDNIEMKELIESKLDSILNVINDTIDYPCLKFIDFQHHEKILSNFFDNLKNLIVELKTERDNFFEMLKELPTKKFDNNNELADCIKKIFLMVLLKILICESFREKCFKDITNFIWASLKT